MDGQALACRDDSFEAVVCRAALMLFPDVLQGLREFRRVLRPGGWVAVSVWPAIERLPMYGVIYAALARQLPDDRDLMLAFRLSDAAQLEGLLTTAGFFDVGVTADRRQIVFDSFDEYWEPFEGGPGRVGQIYRRLPVAARRAVVDEVRRQVAEFEVGGQLVMDVESLFGRGRRPLI
jgi:SAM-dependent methyltransferase